MSASGLISDLETAIAARSHDTGAMLHRITDLFLLNSGHYSTDQLDVYDDVLKTLIDKVEVNVRAALAKRLAPVDDAPAGTIRSLALDDAIEVAEPVLAVSNVLDDRTIGECIAIKGQDHLLAIATRRRISEIISDQLVTKGDNKVLGALASNPGAAISDRAFGMLVEKSVGDDWLAECIALRKDIPEHHFRELLTKASDIVRQRLNVNQAVDPARYQAPAKLVKPGAVKDYRAAALAINAQPLDEAAVQAFAKAKKIDEVVAAIAQLSGLSPAEIERLLLGVWSSPVAIILKAIGFHLPTLEAIYFARLPDTVMRSDGLQIKAEFIAISRATAERIMRFFLVRKSTELTKGSSNTSPSGEAHVRAP